MSRVPSAEVLAALEAHRVHKPVKKVIKPIDPPVQQRTYTKQSRPTTKTPSNTKRKSKATISNAPPPIQRKRARWKRESTEDLWAPKNDIKKVQTERIVYSLPKDQIPEGFSSTLVEKTTLKGSKQIKSVEARPTGTFITPTMPSKPQKTSSASRKVPSTKKPRETTTKTEKNPKERKPAAKKRDRPPTEFERLREASKHAKPVDEIKKPKKPPVIRLSSAFKAKSSNTEEDDEARALEAQRIFAERAARKRRQLQSDVRPENKNKQNDLPPPSKRSQNEIAKHKSSKERTIDGKTHTTSLKDLPRKQKERKDEFARRYDSVSPPQRAGTKRPRPRTEEPSRKRRRRPEPSSSEEDEELDDFIVSDDEDFPRHSGSGRKRHDSNRYKSRREYYSDDSPDMESSFLDIEEEERRSYEIARMDDRRERKREEQRQTEKKRRLGLI